MENGDGTRCTCNHKTPYTVNKCESGTYGTTSLSYMLVQASEVRELLAFASHESRSINPMLSSFFK